MRAVGVLCLAVTAVSILGVVRVSAQGSNRVQAGPEIFATMSSALGAIGAKFNVLIGLEYAVGDQDRTPISLDMSSSEAAMALNSLVAQKPEYKWKLENGVYDVYPKAESDSLLDVAIQKFSVNAATPREISAAIDDVPEVRLWLTTHGVRRNELETGSRWKASDRRISLTMIDTSVRSVLNRVIQLTGRPNWTVVRYGEHLEFIGIYI